VVSAPDMNLDGKEDFLSSGTVDFFLDFPTSHMGGRQYQLLASASGNTPFNYQSINIPLVSNDSIFQAMLGGATGNMFSIPVGGPLARGSDGNVDIALTIAPGQVNHMIGTTLHFSAVDIDPGWPKRASVALPLEILP